MEAPDKLRYTIYVLNNGLAFPALGFGTLIPDPTDTENAVMAALRVGFRQFDCAERLQENLCKASVPFSRYLLRVTGSRDSGCFPACFPSSPAFMKNEILSQN